MGAAGGMDVGLASYCLTTGKVGFWKGPGWSRAEAVGSDAVGADYTHAGESRFELKIQSSLNHPPRSRTRPVRALPPSAPLPLLASHAPTPAPALAFPRTSRYMPLSQSSYPTRRSPPRRSASRGWRVAAVAAEVEAPD